MVSITSGNVTSTFVYDGDGARVKKTEGGQTVLYINGYYEKDLTSGNVTTYYYLGNRLVAMRQSTTLSYIHQDHLTGTSVVSDSNGAPVSSIKYYPFGARRNSQGNLPAQQFTGQRLDSTGLYYYGARYYDPNIGRFISPDTIISQPFNPQSFNRYSYCLNNPLKYIDPTGHWHWPSWSTIVKVVIVVAVVAAATALVVATVGAAAPGLVTVGGLVLGGGAALTAGEVAEVSIVTGLIAGTAYVANNSDADDSLPAAKGNTDTGGQTGGADPNNLPTKRDELLSKATNSKLRNAIDELYRPGASIGDGGTADMIRIVGDEGHITKGMSYLKYLERILTGETLSAADREIAEALYNDLRNALIDSGAITP
jgi:RHS repeat-associated protein